MRRQRTVAASTGEDAAAPPVPNVVARLVALDPGLFAFSIAGASRWRGIAPGLAIPSVHVAAADGGAEGVLEITDAAGAPGEWLAGPSATLLVRAPARGGIALVTAYLGPDAARPPLKLTIRRVDAAVEPPPRTVSFTGSFTGAAESAAATEIGLEIVLHIRGRGDVYFFGSDWAGRVGPGSWVEAFTILPRHERAAAAIEYKGLSASGVETAWLPAGTVCGTTGRNTPLIGFAVRQKAGIAGARFDCEYSGSFESGATSGPARNGAPCRSATENDPLEGLQLRVIDRSPAS